MVSKEKSEPMNYITFLKIKFLNLQSIIAAALGWSASAFTPVAPFILAVICLCILDMITGVQAAKVRIKKWKESNPGKESPEKVTSRGHYRTAQKLFVYISMIIGGRVLNIVFFEPYLPLSIPIAYLLSFPMVWTELKSMAENVQTVTGVNVWDNIKNLKDKFPGGSKK